MTGIEEVLQRLHEEPEFRTQLTSRPWRALAGYDLDDEEREILAVQLLATPPTRLPRRTSVSDRD